MEKENNIETIEGIPVYDAEMIDGNFAHGTNTISLVGDPATKQPVFLFNNQESEELDVISDTLKFASANIKKGLIEGVLMVADKPIFRNINGKKFYLRFKPDLIERMSFKFMKNQFGKNINLEHDPNQEVNKSYLVESYIFDPSRGRTLPSHMNADEVKAGSWIVTLKIEDPEILKKVEAGEIIGYSLEGNFGIKTNFTENFAGLEKSVILDANKSVEDKFKHIKTVVENAKD